ncbi:MAG TPA: N-acetyltransferase [Firmicutes bacterium]|jgi:L-amino acid N-acyltransferase YncA|nr:N-acetyltransferase [Bacillota bacterium]
MEKVELAKIKAEDISALLAIYNYYVLNTTATFHVKVLTEEEMGQLVFFNDPQYETNVIKVEGKICGYVLLTQYKKREAYKRTGEITIYLKSEATGKGIGNAALRYIERVAQEKGFHALIATVCAENEPSIKLFTKNGYQKCAHFSEVGWKFGRWLDIVVFQKILPPPN